MEQVRNEPTIYSTAVYCRLSKDDEQAGESVSIETQKIMLEGFCHERGFPIYEIYTDATVIIGLKQNPTYGRRFSPIFLFIRAFCGAKRKMLL